MNARAVTSLANETVKAARALHQRKTRQETGQFLAEGLKIIIEAIENDRVPSILLYAAESAGHPLLRRAAGLADETLEVTAAILAKISRRDNPQTVLGIFEQAFTPLTDLDPAGGACWVALEAVRDPGNLGTIIRTADAAGCGAVVLIGACCDPYSVEAVRASMGSIFAVQIARATQAEFLAWRRAWPGAVVGTTLSASIDFRRADYRRPTLLIMGNEQAGLTADLAAACDTLAKIPMRGRADSLNLAVATGIMIYAVMG